MRPSFLPLLGCFVVEILVFSSSFSSPRPSIPRRSRNSVESPSTKCPFAAFTNFERNHQDPPSTTAITLPYSNGTNAIMKDIPPLTIVEKPTNALSPWESWLVKRVEGWYRQALSLKCPFWRRRASDILDAADMVMRFLVVRHKSLLGPPPGWRCEGDTCAKSPGLSLEELAAVIRKDWREDTNRGYYITGKLNTTIYRDDCLFEGPDPDMPVRGLRKYLNAASQLFDQAKSRSELLSLEVQGDVIVARWRMRGILRLPWRPNLPVVTGATTYHTDMNGLICRHEETWEMSVVQAFLETFWPKMAARIWRKTESTKSKAEAYAHYT